MPPAGHSVDSPALSLELTAAASQRASLKSPLTQTITETCTVRPGLLLSVSAHAAGEARSTPHSMVQIAWCLSFPLPLVCPTNPGPAAVGRLLSSKWHSTAACVPSHTSSSSSTNSSTTPKPSLVPGQHTIWQLTAAAEAAVLVAVQWGSC